MDCPLGSVIHKDGKEITFRLCEQKLGGWNVISLWTVFYCIQLNVITTFTFL